MGAACGANVSAQEPAEAAADRTRPGPPHIGSARAVLRAAVRPEVHASAACYGRAPFAGSDVASMRGEQPVVTALLRKGHESAVVTGEVPLRGLSPQTREARDGQISPG